MSTSIPSATPFAAILNSMSQALVLADLEGRITYFNQTAGDWFGWAMPADTQLMVTDLLPDFPMHLVEAAQHGKSGTEIYCLPDGGHASVTADPLHGLGIEPGCILSFQLMERLPASPREEAELNHMAEIMQVAFQSSSDGIWVTNGKGDVIDLNKASESLNDISADQVIGRNLVELVKEGVIDQSATLEVIKKRRRVSILQVVRRTGRQLIVTGTPSFGPDGKIALIVVNERDITDLNELRKSLSQLKRVKEKAQAELTGLSLLELKKGHVVAESPAMQKTLATAGKLAQLETSEILLIGESGTGKGLLAKFIHESSPRNAKPFIQVNCATLPPQLFEAELFGYEKGAFTGALTTGKSGLLELAADGTFFLDEVGELPLEIQAKLLKCLDEHEYYPLGAGEPKQVRCIIIAATNRDLEDFVRKKQFREDLYYRLNTFTVRIPPLRERPEDTFELVNHYLAQLNASFKTDKHIGLKGISLLQKHHFSGNVRELIGLLKKAVVISEDNLLDDYLDEMIGGTGLPQATARSLPEAVADVEQEMLRRALTIARTTREMAALLGVSQSAVVRKMRKYRLGGA